jgi:hypothetical protein
MGDLDDPGTFVGRRAESERLRALVSRTAAGSSGLVLIAGEAGVGKTRLLGRTLDEARADGFTVLEGACLPLGGRAAPYVPVVAVLRDMARVAEPGALPAILGPGRRDLARLVPELVDRSADVPPITDPGDPTSAVRLYELVTGTFERLARSAPLIVAIEDVHWADRASRDLLAFTARSLGAQPILLALTVRTDEPTVSEGLRAWLVELERLPRSERLDVGPLTRDEVGTLVGAILGEDDRDIAARIAERSGGNPFLAEELAEASGRRSRGASARSSCPALPVSTKAPRRSSGLHPPSGSGSTTTCWRRLSGCRIRRWPPPCVTPGPTESSSEWSTGRRRSMATPSVTRSSRTPSTTSSCRASELAFMQPWRPP